MDKAIKNLWIGLIVVAIIAITGVFTPVGKAVVQSFGTTNYGELSVKKLQIGPTCNDGFANCTGTLINRINAGTCYIQSYATTIAASSTVKVDCQATAAVGGISTVNDVALTGVTAGDAVQATLATSTAGSTSNGLVIIGASASTTAGYIQLNISNLTGATFTWPVTGTATGTVYYTAMN